MVGEKNCFLRTWSIFALSSPRYSLFRVLAEEERMLFYSMSMSMSMSMSLSEYPMVATAAMGSYSLGSAGDHPPSVNGVATAGTPQGGESSGTMSELTMSSEVKNDTSLSQSPISIVLIVIASVVGGIFLAVLAIRRHSRKTGAIMNKELDSKDDCGTVDDEHSVRSDPLHVSIPCDSVEKSAMTV